MTLDLLDAPLRVTWNLHGKNGTLNAKDAVYVAGALSSAGVFYVTLEEVPLLHPAIGEILPALAAGGCQTLLVCDGSDEELDLLPPDQPIGELFLNAQAFHTTGQLDNAALSRSLAGLREKGYEPSLLLTPFRDNIHAIPELIEFCWQKGVGKFKLPNVKIGDSFWPSVREALLRPEDVKRLRNRLEGDPAALGEKVALEVHDLFLWELLCPGREEGRSEYGGCQAANSLGHVDETGRLHPCSSWPEELGSLLDHSLEDLWQSPGRYRIREEIASVPADCAGCRDYPLCLGGCRGLARYLNGEPGAVDPSCSGCR